MIERHENHRSLAYFRRTYVHFISFLGGMLGILLVSIIYRYKLDNYSYMVSILLGLFLNFWVYSKIFLKDFISPKTS